MEISAVFVPIINIVVIVFLAFNIIQGLRKGVIWELIKTLGVAACALIAWIVSPGIAEVISLYPASWMPFQETVISDALYEKLNDLLWFIIVLLVCLLIVRLIKPLFEAVAELPVLKLTNRLLGMLFALVRSMIWLVILIYVLNSAIFTNGKDIIDQTALKYVQTAASSTMSILGEVFEENVAIQKFMSDPLSLTEEDLISIIEWLEDEQLTGEEITDFLESYGIDVDTINDAIDNLGISE